MNTCSKCGADPSAAQKHGKCPQRGLDEIGELGLDEQAMLLKAIEEKRFFPFGAAAFSGRRK